MLRLSSRVRALSLLLGLAIVASSACGGSDGASSTEAPPTTNSPAANDSGTDDTSSDDADTESDAGGDSAVVVADIEAGLAAYLSARQGLASDFEVAFQSATAPLVLQDVFSTYRTAIFDFDAAVRELDTSDSPALTASVNEALEAFGASIAELDEVTAEQIGDDDSILAAIGAATSADLAVADIVSAIAHYGGEVDDLIVPSDVIADVPSMMGDAAWTLSPPTLTNVCGGAVTRADGFVNLAVAVSQSSNAIYLQRLVQFPTELEATEFVDAERDRVTTAECETGEYTFEPPVDAETGFDVSSVDTYTSVPSTRSYRRVGSTVIVVGVTVDGEVTGTTQAELAADDAAELAGMVQDNLS